MNKKIWILLSLFFLISITSFGQENGKTKVSEEKPDSVYVLGKGRIVYKNKIYRQNAPYMTLGYGIGYGFQADKIEQNMSGSFQYFFKEFGLQLGYHSSSNTKIWWQSYQKLNDLFLCVGKRWESTRYNLSVFGGPSWAYGNYLVTDSTHHGFHSVGFHAEALATYKITYDMGVGFSVCTSLNNNYSSVGAQIHLFFSTAFIRNNY